MLKLIKITDPTFLVMGGVLLSRFKDISKMCPEVQDVDPEMICLAVSTHLIKLLDSQSLDALIKHEEGHFINNHIEKLEATFDQQVFVEFHGVKVCVNNSFEMEADAYAIKLCGKEAYKKAIDKYYDVMFESELIKSTMIEIQGLDAYNNFIEIVREDYLIGSKWRWDAIANS